MNKIKRVPIDSEIADALAARIFALQGTVECVRVALTESGETIKPHAVDALCGVSGELERIACDLDVCAWEDIEPDPAPLEGPPTLKVVGP